MSLCLNSTDAVKFKELERLLGLAHLLCLLIILKKLIDTLFYSGNELDPDALSRLLGRFL